MLTPDLPRRVDWRQLTCRAVWCYRGQPASFQGNYTTHHLIFWHIQVGSVRVVCPEREVIGEADSWVVPVHGPRRQEFSPDARIESLHLRAECPGAQWHGPPVVNLGGDERIQKAYDQLLPIANPKGLTRWAPGQFGGDRELTVEEHARLQRVTWAFLEAAIPLLAESEVTLRFHQAVDPRIERSRELVDALPLALPWNRTLMASTAGLSPSQLDRLWLAELEMTPFHYWEQRRHRFAREHLESSGHSIKEIASDLGFAELAQFSNWFRRRHGRSPRSYREAMRGAS